MQKHFDLSDGTKMPAVGLGTFGASTPEEVVMAIKENGYRHIDAAKVYKNEEAVGKGINQCLSEGVVTREELYVCTKIWPSDLGDCEAACKASLERLGLEYVDLYLIHWPGHFEETKEPLHVIWPRMEKLVELGLTKSIGVSNFNIQLLGDLLTYAKIRPVCNQVELNPWLQQNDLVKFCKSKDVLPVAYTPIYKGTEMAQDPVLMKIAEAKGVSAVQVALNWNVGRGVAVIPKSSNKERQRANIEIFHFTLSEEERGQIVDQNKRIYGVFEKWGGVCMFA